MVWRMFGKGVHWCQGIVGLTCGCLWRGWAAPCPACKCFQAHSCLLSFILISFSFKRLVRGHCSGVVTNGGNVTHKHFTEMRRLAHDETPFLLAMSPRATTLAQWPNFGSVIPLHAHGPNRLARDETPFSWLCHQEPLPWHGDQLSGSVIPLHAHRPNRLAHDETPYPLVRSCFIIFPGPSCFLLRSILLLI